MTTIELTDEQRQALQAEQGQPIHVVDPATQQRYVLLGLEQYERVRSLLEQGPGPEQPGVAPGILPGLLRCQQAFWRDLPELLAKKLRGKWVCYHRDGRIGIADDDETLIRECLRRGIPDDEYYLARIRPRALPPWDPEEIEPLGLHHPEDYHSEA